MRLVALRLENFRRFKDAHIEFPDGLVGLVGPNGAGKSSILEAVGWALFGNGASRTTKDLLPRRGSEGEPCRVTLTFELSGQEYVVVRELQGKSLSPSASVTVAGSLVVSPGANSAQEATDHLARVLHMDEEAFFTSLVARQKDLAALTDLTPGRRKEVVMRMLGVDAIDDAIRIVRDRKREERARLDALSAGARDVAALRLSLAQARSDEEAVSSDARALEQEVSAIAASLQEAKARRDDLGRRREEFELHSSRLERRRERVALMDKELEKRHHELSELGSAEERLRELSTSEEEYHRTRKDVEALERVRDRHRDANLRRREVEHLAAEAQRLRATADEKRQTLARRAHVREEMAHLSGRRVELLSRVREMTRDLHGAGIEVEQGNARLTDVQARREHLASFGPESPCPTCERELGDCQPALLAKYDAEVLDLEDRIARAWERKRTGERQLAEVEAELRQIDGRLGELAAEVEALGRLETEVEHYLKRQDEVQERIGHYEKAIAEATRDPFDESTFTRMKGSLVQLEALHETAIRLRGEMARRAQLSEEISLLSGDLDIIREDLRLMEERLEGLHYDRGAYESAVQACERAQDELHAKTLLLERRHGEVTRLGADRARLEQEVDEQTQLTARIEAARTELLHLERLAGDRDAGLLPDFKDHVVGRIRPALAHNASEIFRLLTEGRYAGLEVTEDYDLRVVEDGVAYDLARASGGEADLANLALRVAIGEVVAERSGAPMQFLALDEVFGSQDEVRKQSVLRTLHGLSGRFRQILVVTHVDEVKENVDHAVAVVPRPEGWSEIAAP
ncbi:MAG TPA: SMC family ATPase [Candidatus Thermoplasmatota archaeon]|nr:SMC family ATPase [Candidatus Thermoplasmatota archaeon]